MEMDRLQEWMKVAQQYQGNSEFWTRIFDKESKNPFVDNFIKDEPDDDLRLRDFPRSDIYITDTHIVVIIEVPGVRKEDLHLSCTGSKLLINVKSIPPFQGVTTVLNERIYGEHERSIELPEAIDSSQLHTSFNNGLLVLSYPRHPETFTDITLE
ncbi:Hsp20/alpha crystallin family protein [Halobacillus massiliensis]|uniref:Hsp20/alpha crystallin family protein n=1 Tax=Halobacillus massiliensis TaxID=1926286 RepID=UPI0009E25A87|nr:Hsp20/alpha crystallin family protein [Halobacillus massiliensis]